MPIQNEREAVMKYYVERKLVRPKTSIITVVLYILLLEILILVLSYLLVNLLFWFGISLDFSIVYTLITIGVFYLGLKKLSILIVELYQHYASVQLRSQCTLKPSCSEYAILALNKYGVFKALYKSYIRLFKTCKGDTYRIDYP